MERMRWEPQQGPLEERRTLADHLLLKSSGLKRAALALRHPSLLCTQQQKAFPTTCLPIPGVAHSHTHRRRRNTRGTTEGTANPGPRRVNMEGFPEDLQGKFRSLEQEWLNRRAEATSCLWALLVSQ